MAKLDSIEFDDLFSPTQLNILNYLIFNNIAALKELGHVDIQTEKNGELSIETTTFKSFDGLYNYSISSTVFNANETHEQVSKLNTLIAEAVAVENYEEASILKKQKDKLLNNQ